MAEAGDGLVLVTGDHPELLLKKSGDEAVPFIATLDKPTCS